MSLPTPDEVVRDGYMLIECHIPNMCEGCAFDYVTVGHAVHHLCDWAECGMDHIFIEDCDYDAPTVE